VVVEGVETPEQAHWAVQAGCDYLQGYLIGRPAAAQEGLPELGTYLQVKGMIR
jgi:EAL domain-containing protein (putative c-di-GMP-specific phosphodiesterase class I)